MVIPSACYEMDTSLDGAWWVGAAAAVAKAPRVYPSLGGFFCAPLVPSRPSPEKDNQCFHTALFCFPPSL